MAFLYVSFFNVYWDADNKLGCSKFNNKYPLTDKFRILGKDHSCLDNNYLIHLDFDSP